MNKQEYYRSFLKPGQTKLPRKLKKKARNLFRGDNGPIIVTNLTQFLNIYKSDSETYKDTIERFRGIRWRDMRGQDNEKMGNTNDS